MEPIVLASGSPRRQEILKKMGIPFTVMPDNSPEEFEPELSFTEQIEKFAIKKVKNIIKATSDVNVPWILGADTMILYNNKLFGKPATREEAKEMISGFSGNTHTVITAIALWSSKNHELTTSIRENQVTFDALSQDEIEAYLDIGEWQGAAGGYRIQGEASKFIKEIKGSYTSIMGLSIRDIYVMLKEQGYLFN